LLTIKEQELKLKLKLKGKPERKQIDRLSLQPKYISKEPKNLLMIEETGYKLIFSLRN
jgi:hypothetical protein